MKAFVLDASLTMEWFGGTPSAGALTKRSLFDDRVAVIPHLWRFKVMNVLTTWRRRGDITGAQGSHILHNVMQWPFTVIDEGSPDRPCHPSRDLGLRRLIPAGGHSDEPTPCESGSATSESGEERGD